MRIVLLGPNGQLGSDITAAATRRGGLDILPIGRDALDVSDTTLVPSVLGNVAFDALVNCTSFHRTDDAEERADLAFAINAFAVKAVAEACERRGARFVHISTDYVFDGQGRDRPYGESDGVGPLNVYGASKAMGEALARQAVADCLILRVASLFGVAGASGKGGNFVETMIRVGRERGHLRVVDDIVMSPTATADVAEQVLDLLACEAPAGTYHMVNAGEASWYDFARAIIDRAGIDAVVEATDSNGYPTKALRPRYSVLDASKLASVTTPMPHWTDALDRYLRSKGHLG